MNKTKFYHIFLNNINTPETLSTCKAFFETEGNNTINFVNAHCFNISVIDKAYLAALKESDLLLNDGIGIKLASKLKHIKLKENMNGTDFIPRLIELAVKEGKSIYLLGAKPKIIDEAVDKLKSKYANIKIAGYHHGYFSQDEELKIIEDINISKADLLILGLGVPIQEKWVMRNRAKLETVRLTIAAGAVFDFISGKVVRASKFTQKIGLEWLWRFMQEPKRLFRRYFIGNFIFFYHILFNKKLNH